MIKFSEWLCADGRASLFLTYQCNHTMHLTGRTTPTIFEFLTWKKAALKMDCLDCWLKKEKEEDERRRSNTKA